MVATGRSREINRCRLVAEGVESSEQLEALRDEACDQVQGYPIAHPNPIAHFAGVVIDRDGDACDARRSAG